LLDQPNFLLTPDQAVHVFKILLEFMLLIKKKNYCHSDIKPDNTQLVRSQSVENAYILKLIDFGALTKN
jgi:serine/threonine protein kinase